MCASEHMPEALLENLSVDFSVLEAAGPLHCFAGGKLEQEQAQGLCHL